MINWNDWKSLEPSVVKVDDLESSSLSILYSNCIRMGNLDNSNVGIASASPDIFLNEMISLILENVSYIARGPMFTITSIIDGKVLLSTSYSCETEEFDTLGSLKDFISTKGKFSTLVLYSIVKYIELDKLTFKFILRYKEIANIKAIRDKKIDYLTTNNNINGINNN